MNNIFFACTFSFCCCYCGCCCCLPCCMGSYAHFCICYTHKHKQKHFTPCVDVFRVFFICHCINIIFSSHHIVSTLLFFAFGCVLHFINATLFIFFLFILVSLFSSRSHAHLNSKFPFSFLLLLFRFISFYFA